MTCTELRCFLNLLMCSDPWPVKPNRGEQEILLELADRESRKCGYDNWVVAYHELAEFPVEAK